MTTTRTDIANVALKALGHKRIDSIDQETKAARTLRAFYDEARRATLREHPWNFAKQEKRLAPAAVTYGTKWGYEHPLPVDFVRLCDVRELDGDYEVKRVPGVGRVVACDDTPIDIEYIADVTVEAEFDPSFVMAFALKLAALAAVDITGSATVAEEMDGRYKQQLRTARGVDAQENGAQEIEQLSSWNAARF